MNGRGSTIFLTGGTTGQPKRVFYDSARWQRSVRIKSRLFEHFGIDGGHRVAVCHPFAPWSIGSIFCEGALTCGATVLPLGLSAEQEPFRTELWRFGPTDICASPRNLIRWGTQCISAGQSEATSMKAVERLFVSGELLTSSHRTQLQRLWPSKIVNVYGLAEFDMLGAELIEGLGISLVPEFRFGCAQDPHGAVREFEVGAAGLLAVAEPESNNWLITGDDIEVRGHSREWKDPYGRMSWTINIRGRTDGAAFFADGSMLSGIHVSRMLNTAADLNSVQIVITRSLDGDAIRILTHCRDGAVMDEEAVKCALLSSAVDVADSYKHGIIRSIKVHFVKEDEFIVNARGKPPAIVDGDEVHYELSRQSAPE